MSTLKNIGVLTSGGDAPGMNAVIRAVVRMGINSGLKVFGIERGYYGLLRGEIYEMNARSVSDIISNGGTMLKTARCKEFMKEEGVRKGKEMTDVFKLDALVVIGGDGSYKGAYELSKIGVPVIGVPGTIDNDISCTEYTIGFDTAINTVGDAIDKIRDTAYSHERCSVVEVMGRRAGYIALTVGISGGVESIVLPEKKFDINEDIIKPIFQGRNRGKQNFIVVLAEGVGGAIEISDQIEKSTGMDCRATILGHIQRGGKPTVHDRYIASIMGSSAVKTLVEGRKNRIISLLNNKIVDIDIGEALKMEKFIDENSIQISKMLSI